MITVLKGEGAGGYAQIIKILHREGEGDGRSEDFYVYCN